jgi:hypothetical protein
MWTARVLHGFSRVHGTIFCKDNMCINHLFVAVQQRSSKQKNWRHPVHGPDDQT